MISYRKLAMRVLGHPLRVPTNTSRPASHRVTALALTAAMVAGMAAPAYAGTYYIGDGDITITKDEKGDVYVKHADNKDKSNGDVDNGDIIIKGGKRSEDTTDPVSNSSKSSTPANSPVQSALTTLKAEDSENEDKDRVYLGGTKTDTTSDGGGEENETKSTEKTQTNDTTDGKNTGAGSSDPESKGSGDGTSGSGGGSGSGGTNAAPKGGGEENAPQPSGTTGSDDTTGNEENKTQSGDTTGSRTLAKGTESSSPVLESQFTYTSANNDEETPNESTTTLKTAADNFKAAAQNVIRIINKLAGNDNTLNVTLDNVNITANNDAALSVEGAGDTKITLKGDNKLTSGDHHAGLEHNEKSDDGSSSVGTGKLTITSEKEDGKDTGSLTATGDSGAAGIGGAWSKGAGTIEIAGGNITAISPISQSGRNDNDGGAGIGSGAKATGSTNTNINISGGTIVEAVGGTNGDGIGGSSSNRNNPTTVTISGGTIQKAQGGQGYGSYDGGSGIHSDGDLTISGKAHIVSATGGSGDSSNSRSDAGDGIRAGTLTISGEAHIDNATGGTADSGSAGDGIYNYGKLTIKDNAKIGTVKGGDATASGKDGGYGIRNHGQFTMSGGTITNAVGGMATGRTGDGGDGIYCGDTLTIEGGEIQQTTGGEATGKSGTGGSGIRGGSGKSGGDGIGSYGNLTISQSAKIETAQGGTSTNGNGGSGISSGGILTISGSAKIGTAQGGASTNGTGGDGIHSGSVVKISGDTTTKATGGNATGENSTGGSGIGGSFVNVEGGTINTTGGSGKSGGAGVSTESGIVSIGNSDTPLDLTATAPDADNAIQSRDGKKLLDEVIHLMDKNNKLGLVKLVEDDENIETIVFSTERCTSTLSLSDVAALGADDTPFTLSHSGSTATFTVGGADHSALLR